MPNLSQYICSLFDGVSDAVGFSWKAFQWIRAWTPVDRSAVSKIALADPAEGSDDVADDLDDSALVESSRHIVVRGLRSWPVRAAPQTPILATVMSRAREQALSAC